MSLTDEELQLYAKSADETVATLSAETIKLREGINRHRENTGHALCWLNDLELWRLLDDAKVAYPHETLPVKDEFFAQCRLYYESRLKGTPYEEPQPKNTVTTAQENNAT